MAAIKIARMDARGRIAPEERERVRPLLIELLKEKGSLSHTAEEVGVLPQVVRRLVPEYHDFLSEKSLNKGRHWKRKKVAKRKKYARRAKLDRRGRALTSPKLRPMLAAPVDLDSGSCTVIVVRGTNVMQALLAAAAEHAK